jgi:hypothetical protein
MAVAPRSALASTAARLSERTGGRYFVSGRRGLHLGVSRAQPSRSDTSPRLSARFPFCRISNYCWKTGGAPLTRFHFSETFTSTRLAILTKGIFLFIP